MQNKFGDKVTDPADPNRCQSNVKEGQCPYLAVPGTPYCPRHGGTSIEKKQDARAAKMYQLTQWRSKMDQLKQSPEAKSLGEEIAILRMTLEATLEKCKSTEDLFMMSSTIGDLAVKIEKVIKSSHSLDQASGNLMDKSKAIAFAGTVVEIVDRVLTLFITDVEMREKIVDQIAQGILKSLQEPEREVVTLD
jgi:hypothetical protein